MPSPASPSLPFADFASRTLALYRPPMKAPATFKKMRFALESLRSLTSIETTEDLTTQTIAAWISARQDLESNINTTISLLMSLRAASHYAVEEGWIERIPNFKRIWPRRAPSQKRRHFAHAQVVALLDSLSRKAGEGWRDHRLYALTALVCYTGLRLREALYLEREDIDLSKRMIWISARRRLKTVSSAAPVPIAEELVPILRAWLLKAHKDWVFPGVTMRAPWDGGSIGYRPVDRLRKAAEAIGIEGVTFHGLRHTLAKLLVHRFGRMADQTKSILRHDDVRTTEEHYLHRSDAESLREIVDGLSFKKPA